MTAHLRSILLIAITIAFAAPEVLADGDRIVIQLRTDAVPGADFDSVTTELFDTDGSTLIEVAVHFVDPTRDYGPGVRVAEFELGPGFDSGTYSGRTVLRLSGTAIAERPWRARFAHGHPHSYPTGFFGIDAFEVDPGNPKTRVITLLIPIDFFPILQASKVATLEVDNDANGVISPGDVLRYTIPFFTSHALRSGSVLRDIPDLFNPLIPGSVITSSGTVIRGNLPSDTEVAVRFDAVPRDDLVSVSYLVRVSCVRPEIINQGALALRLASSSTQYDRLTDDPFTPAQDDPTIVQVICGLGDPLPTPVDEVADVLPPVVPQYTTAVVVIASAGLGTASGPPTLTINGFSVKTEILLPEEQNEVATISANLTREMTPEAGVIPFTLTPADPQLPDVKGVIGVRAALGSAQEISDILSDSVADSISRLLDENLEKFQAARARAHADPASCDALKTGLTSDLQFSAKHAASQIIGLGDIALQQAIFANANPVQLDEIKQSVSEGVELLDEMNKKLLNKVTTKRKKGKKGNKQRGFVCAG